MESYWVVTSFLNSEGERIPLLTPECEVDVIGPFWGTYLDAVALGKEGGAGNFYVCKLATEVVIGICIDD